MPMYVYEAREPARGCAHCAQGFEVMQSIHDPKLTACPVCGAAVYRVIQPRGSAAPRPTSTTAPSARASSA